MSDSKRWASRALVTMLIREDKNYRAAAEIVSGSEASFLLHSKDIGDLIARVKERPTGASSKELREVLENVREDINSHREWERDVLDSLERVDDEEGLTGPLRQAFSQVATVRVKLQAEVMEASEKWLDAQGGAFTPQD
ncbi:MAG: hypothetical protein C0508_01610 [Cyanobacteria bacterium PR.023]|nr:hypothetical protein [Cyanobacteria bacterium PR.023]